MLIDMARGKAQEALVKLFDVAGGEGLELAEFVTQKSLEFDKLLGDSSVELVDSEFQIVDVDEACGSTEGSQFGVVGVLSSPIEQIATSREAKLKLDAMLTFNSWLEETAQEQCDQRIASILTLISENQ